jgi:hypothetical protein
LPNDEQQTAKELWIEQAVRFIKQNQDEAEEVVGPHTRQILQAQVAGMVRLTAELSVLDVDEIWDLLKTSKQYQSQQKPGKPELGWPR